MRSNPVAGGRSWKWAGAGSNRRLLDFQSRALPLSYLPDGYVSRDGHYRRGGERVKEISGLRMDGEEVLGQLDVARTPTEGTSKSRNSAAAGATPASPRDLRWPMAAFAG